MDNNENKSTPLLLAVIEILFTSITVVNIFGTFIFQNRIAQFFAFIVSVLLVYLFILTNKKIDESKNIQAYSIFISGILLINFILAFTCNVLY